MLEAAELMVVMLRELWNFSFQRTPLQAAGWYLGFLLIYLIIGTIITGVIAGLNVSRAEGLQTVNLVWRVVTVLFVAVVGIRLIWTRPKGFINILLLLAALVPSVSILLGMVPLAVLTTRPSNKTVKEVAGVFE